MHRAHVLTSGGYISGEVKLGITLRLLAGGDALDLGALFDVSSNWCRDIFYEVLEYWIVSPNLGGMNIKEYLSNPEALRRVSAGFSQRSNGVLRGAIGAMDGWLVKIIRPSWRLDKIRNVVGFFSRKGFYALNVQCMVDHQKKVLWASYDNRGSSHDSSVFRDTDFYELLKENSDRLLSSKHYILGDSAYAIESFIIPPYDSAGKCTAEDDFNFYHSSARITVECAFGEIDLRWGVFWKRLCSSVNHNILICEGAMHLHNFLVDYRNKLCEGEADNTIDMSIFVDDMCDNGVFNMVVLNDSNRGDGGRPTNIEKQRRIDGVVLRDELRDTLQNHNMHRPKKSDVWDYDRSNHIVLNTA